MKRAKLGTKSKKAIPARKPASLRIRLIAKTKTAKAKIFSAPKNKSRPATKRKKVSAQVKRSAKKPAPGVPRKLSGPPTRKAKFVRQIPAPRKSKAAAPIATRTPLKIAATKITRAKLKAAPKRKITSRVAPTKSPRKLSVRKPTRVSKPTLPAFLLEGDEPSFLTESGAAEKFSLGPTAPPDHFDEGNASLPSSYGTGKLFLTARDPHWLYAHWDFTHEEQFRHNAKSIDRHLILRLHDEAQPQKYVAEIHVHPESKHWFVHVEQAGRNYSTELGYYSAGRNWKSLATSATQRTPPDTISADSTVEFATIPLELSFETMLCLLKENSGNDAAQNVPLARAIENIRHRTQQHFPEAMHIADWTLEQEQLLAEILAADTAGIALPSSHDSAGVEDQIGDSSFIESPSSYVSSFFGGVGEPDFWLNVNAELIIYGATEPDANVSLAGKQIPLRADGSFRFQFALPDGNYAMPVVAVSADGTDGRAVELKFSRATETQGQVGVHSQESSLNPPPSTDV
jgi:hypothetical protein